MKSEDYQEKIKDLEETIAVLTAQRKTMAEGMLPKNVDIYAIKFMQEITDEDIQLVSTKELFDRFVEYRRQFTSRNEQLLSMRMFNSVVRSVFPNAEIKHSNRGGSNVYFWVNN